MSGESLGPPGWATLARARVALELRLFVRERQQLVFSFLYPLIMLVIFGSVFRNDTVAGGVTYTQYFLAGIAATGVMLASFQNLGISVPLERDEGELGRLQNLALPPISYFVGKAGLVLVLTVSQLVGLLFLARAVYAVPLPTTTTQWATFVWAGVLGATAGSALGLAIAALPSSSRSAAAIVAPVALVLQFFSGVFFVYTELPPWMRQVAALFPLKWLTQAMRSAFLPDGAKVAEVAGSWQRLECALVLLIWTIGGALVAWRTFSWRPRE
jgi:ABC-2 type transport system permease protein